jgi:hypothetical protein
LRALVEVEAWLVCCEKELMYSARSEKFGDKAVPMPRLGFQPSSFDPLQKHHDKTTLPLTRTFLVEAVRIYIQNS